MCSSDLNHAYNLWYTLATPPGDDFDAHLDALHRASGATVTRKLPTLTLYKIGVKLDMTGRTAADVKRAAEARRLNLRYLADGAVCVSFGETVTDTDLADLLACFGNGATPSPTDLGTLGADHRFEARFARSSAFMTHPVFNTHHSEKIGRAHV